MTKKSKKQLHILVMHCHNQGIPILGNIQIVSKDSAKKYGLTAKSHEWTGI